MALSGYCGAVSYRPGQRLELFLSTTGTPGKARVTVRRHAGSESMSFMVAVEQQPIPAANAWEGFGWTRTASRTIPTTWPSGYYEVYGPANEQIGAFAL